MRATGLASLALAASLLPPAAVADIGAQFVINDIRAMTPPCRDNPDAPWIGRVSGLIGSFPSRGASFVGCFPTREACERWRGPVTGRITARLTQSSCKPRRR